MQRYHRWQCCPNEQAECAQNQTRPDQVTQKMKSPARIQPPKADPAGDIHIHPKNSMILSSYSASGKKRQPTVESSKTIPVCNVRQKKEQA
jgi:hypothetical protein